MVRAYVDAVRSAPELSVVLTLVLTLFTFSLFYFRAVVGGYDPASFGQTMQGVWYFADYSDGFTRRAFVGAVLDALGPSDVAEAATLTATAVTALACALLALLAVRFAGLASGPARRLTLFTVVLTSPLFLSTFWRDLGRLDAVGILCGAVSLGVLRSQRLPYTVTGPVAAVALAAATATEEFLFLYLAPLAVISLWFRPGVSRSAWRSPTSLAQGAAMVLPSAVVLVGSLAVTASPGYLARLTARAGIDPEEPTSPGSVLWALQQTSRDAHAFVWSAGRDQLVVVLICAGTYLLTTAGIHLLLRPQRAYWLLVVGFGSVAAVLGVTAVDARRFWALSLVALVASCLALGRRTSGERLVGHGQGGGESLGHRISTSALVTACLIVAATGQSMPLWGGELAAWLSSVHQALFYFTF